MRFHLVLLLSGLTLGAVACGGEPQADESPTITVLQPSDVARAIVQPISDTATLAGTLEPEQQAKILAEVTGTVTRVAAETGQAVRPGVLLAAIEAADLEDMVRSAEAAVRSAQTAFEMAEREASRAETLAAAGAIARRNAETAQAQLANARSQLAAARSQLVSARERLEATRVLAPISGVVSERNVSAGDVVNPGMPLFTIIDPSTIRLEASVPASAANTLEVGAPVAFEVRGLPDQQLSGRVERIAPMVDSATGQVRVQVTIPNPGAVRVAGLFAEGRVQTEVRSGLVVPDTAIDESAGAPTVLRIRNGRTERVRVVLGVRAKESGLVEVAQGLEPGDLVIIGPARSVGEGVPVRVGNVESAKG